MLRNLIDSGDWTRALGVSGQILAHEPEDAWAHRMHALSALNLDRHKLARKHIEFAIANEPDHPFPHYLMGMLFEKENRSLYAKKHFLKSIELDPENADYWCQYGFNCAIRGDFISAREAAKKALELEPESHQPEQLLALVNAHDHHGEESTKFDAYEQIEAYEKVLELDPEDDVTIHQIGLVYLEDLEDADNAERHFRRALFLDPTEGEYRRSLFKAIRRKDPVLRVLWWPWRLFQKGLKGLERGVRDGSPLFWMLPLALLAGPAVLVIFMLWAVFLLAPAVVYEYLAMRELRNKAGEITIDDRGIAAVYSLPFFARFVLFLVLFVAFVSSAWWALTNPDFKEHIGDVIGALFLVFLIAGFWFSAKNPYKE